MTELNQTYGLELAWPNANAYPLSQLAATYAHEGPRRFAGVVVVAWDEGHAGPLLFICNHHHGTVYSAQQCARKQIVDTVVNEV